MPEARKQRRNKQRRLNAQRAQGSIGRSDCRFRLAFMTTWTLYRPNSFSLTRVSLRPATVLYTRCRLNYKSGVVGRPVLCAQAVSVLAMYKDKMKHCRMSNPVRELNATHPWKSPLNVGVRMENAFSNVDNVCVVSHSGFNAKKRTRPRCPSMRVWILQ